MCVHLEDFFAASMDLTPSLTPAEIERYQDLKTKLSSYIALQTNVASFRPMVLQDFSMPSDLIRVSKSTRFKFFTHRKLQEVHPIACRSMLTKEKIF